MSNPNEGSLHAPNPDYNANATYITFIAQEKCKLHMCI